MSAPVLELEGLTAGYDGAAVIRDIDLDRRAGRDRRPARGERRGQDDDAARRLRPRAPDGRRDPLPGPGSAARAAERAREARHRARPGESRPLLRAHRRRALPPRLSRRAPRRGRGVPVLPGAHGASRPALRPPLRRRAADARGRARACPPSEAPAAGRAEPRPGAGHRRGSPAGRPRVRRGERLRRRPRRAAHRAGADDCRPGLTSLPTARLRWRARPSICGRTTTSLSRATSASTPISSRGRNNDGAIRHDTVRDRDAEAVAIRFELRRAPQRDRSRRDRSQRPPRSSRTSARPLRCRGVP